MLYLVLKSDQGIAAKDRWNGIGMRGNASSSDDVRGRARSDESRALSPAGRGSRRCSASSSRSSCSGTAAISVGICEAAVQATQRHLTSARFEHSGTVSRRPPQPARAARRDADRDRSRPRAPLAPSSTRWRTPADDAAPRPRVEGRGLRIRGQGHRDRHARLRRCGVRAPCGLERLFRDARAAVVMAPTTDHTHEFIGRALCGMELLLMEKPVIVGAVLYDPKVSVIWEIIRDFFDETGVRWTSCSTRTTSCRCTALVDGHLDIAWNSPLAWLDSQRRLRRQVPGDRHARHGPRPRLAFRREEGRPGPIDGRSPRQDDRRRSQGFAAGHAHSAWASSSATGSSRDGTSRSGASTCSWASTATTWAASTRRSSASPTGEAAACAMLDLNWERWTADGTIDPREYGILATTDRFDHCVFTVRDELCRGSQGARWLDALFSMTYDEPEPPRDDGPRRPEGLAARADDRVRSSGRGRASGKDSSPARRMNLVAVAGGAHRDRPAASLPGDHGGKLAAPAGVSCERSGRSRPDAIGSSRARPHDRPRRARGAPRPGGGGSRHRDRRRAAAGQLLLLRRREARGRAADDPRRDARSSWRTRPASSEILQTLDVPAYSISNPTCVGATGAAASRSPWTSCDSCRRHTDRAGEGPAARTVPPDAGHVRAGRSRGRSMPRRRSSPRTSCACSGRRSRELIAAGAAFIQFDEPVLTELVFTQGGRGPSCARRSRRGRTPPRSWSSRSASSTGCSRDARGSAPGSTSAAGTGAGTKSTLLRGGYRAAPALSRANARATSSSSSTRPSGPETSCRFAGKELGLGVVNPRTDRVGDSGRDSEARWRRR